MRPEQQSFQLTIADEQPRPNPDEASKKIRHIYLQQQNIYGRFIPYLLLKDQLESEVDSSGNTALHHMCSHNSPYLPLFLSSIPDGDPILNRKSKLGHTPLDVAGLYCTRENIELLKAKGAVDNGNVDYWAIQGGNIANWSGKVYPNRKDLIHWAAYNDLPDVIAEYAREGVSVSEPDSNGFTPIDLTILNKSYNSMRVLTDLGERPKPELLKSCNSKSIKQHFQRLEEKGWKKMVKKLAKIFSLMSFLAICLVLNPSQVNMSILTVCIAIMIHILIRPAKSQPHMDHNRRTQFISQLFLNKPINRTNHKAYLLLHILLVTTGTSSVYFTTTTSHLQAILILIALIFTLCYGVHFAVQVYGICRNLTHEEMFYAHRWPHLWDHIKYVNERKFVIREWRNGEDRGTWANLRDYFLY